MKKTSSIIQTINIWGNLATSPKVSLRDVRILNIRREHFVTPFPLWNSLQHRHISLAQSSYGRNNVTHSFVIGGEDTHTALSEPHDLVMKSIFQSLMAEQNIIGSKSAKPNIVYNTSGICQLHKFKLNLDNTINKAEYTYDLEALKEVPPILGKAILALLSGRPIKDLHDLCMRLPLLLNKDNCCDSKFFYPVVQHIIISLAARVNVPLSVIRALTNGQVNFSEFLGPNDFSNALAIVEQYFFNATFGDFIREQAGKVVLYAQNEAFLEANKELEPFKTFRSEAYRQTGQPNTDGRLEISKTAGGPVVKRVYVDCKAIKDPVTKLSLSRGYVSLTTTRNDTLFMKRAKADYQGSLINKDKTTKINKETGVEEKKYNIKYEETVAVESYCMKLENILKSKISLKEKFVKFTTLQKEMLLDEELIHVVPSFISVPPNNDPAFSALLENSPEVAWIINKIRLELENQDVVEHLFPLEQKVHIDFWLQFISKILNEMPASDLKDVLKQNFKKANELL